MGKESATSPQLFARQRSSMRIRKLERRELGSHRQRRNHGGVTVVREAGLGEEMRALFERFEAKQDATLLLEDLEQQGADRSK